MSPAPRRAARPAATSAERTDAPKTTVSNPLSSIEPGEDVDARLRAAAPRGRVVGDEDLGGAEAAGAGRELLHARAGHDRGDVAAELRGLREHAERALDELALVVLEEDEGRHQRSFLSARYSTIFSAACPSSSMRTLSPREGGSESP